MAENVYVLTIDCPGSPSLDMGTPKPEVLDRMREMRKITGFLENRSWGFIGPDVVNDLAGKLIAGGFVMGRDFKMIRGKELTAKISVRAVSVTKNGGAA